MCGGFGFLFFNFFLKFGALARSSSGNCSLLNEEFLWSIYLADDQGVPGSGQGRFLG